MLIHWKLLILQIISCAIFSQPVEAGWDYMILKWNWNSTDEKVLRAPLRPVRISPGVYGLSGTIEVGVPLDNSFSVKFNIYRSPSGSSNFVMTPFHIPTTPFVVFLNTFYRQFAMNEVKNCSDFPVFQGRFKGPLEPTVFHLEKCMLGTKNLPTIFRSGFYKTVIRVTSPLVKFVGELVAQALENAS